MTGWYIVLLWLILLWTCALCGKKQNVKTLFKVSNHDAIRGILQHHKIHNIAIHHAPCVMKSSYNMKTKVISTAASSHNTLHVAIAAHEAGHAIQHAIWYTPFCIHKYSGLSLLACYVVTLIFVSFSYWIPVVAMSLAVLTRCNTAWMERDASCRAVTALTDVYTLNTTEQTFIAKLLRRPLMTYVMACLMDVTLLVSLVYHPQA